MSALPWMPLYPADYLADTRRLTTEQHGAYLLLLLDSWVSGALPDDDSVLARVAGMDAESWTATRRALAGYFQIADGMWVHARLERERIDAHAHAHASSGRGKKAAAARWSKKVGSEIAEKPAESVDNSPENAHAHAQALHMQYPPPSPLHNKTPVVNDDVESSDSSALGQVAAPPLTSAEPSDPGSARAAADERRTRAGELCRLARDIGRAENMSVTAQPASPTVLEWVAAGVTDDEVRAACETALLNRKNQGSRQAVNAGYLDKIIADNRAAKSKGAGHGANQGRVTAAAAWGAEFAEKIGGAGGREAERCIDGEAVVIDTGQAVG